MRPITGKLPQAVDSWPAELAAIPELDDVALGHGLVNGRPDSDGVIRSVPLVMRAGGQPRPGFALEIARNALGAETIDVDGFARPRRRPQASRSTAMAGCACISAPSQRTRSSRPPTCWEMPSSSNRTRSPARPVLIGLSADGTSDIAATPLAAEEFGPLVQAQAVDAILRGGWLERPGWAGPAEWAAAATARAPGARERDLRPGPIGSLLAALSSWPCPSSAGWPSRTPKLLLDPARPLLVGGGALGRCRDRPVRHGAGRSRAAARSPGPGTDRRRRDRRRAAGRPRHPARHGPAARRGCGASIRGSTSTPCWSRPSRSAATSTTP